ncbi:MAG: NUDIX hydrolase [Candidatus Marinimicrobia bacterium]|jgi:8-oxo-dGTP pyrophosphatase MutT (NUDIX family)|nr:NUDIX hydrolase [Candidatus Neomarinimicrobiota bacterium]MDP7037233.1 NUDIX hydrolase [Candidatus Neomarinimicrobiota bacterium]|tara:strand:- start:2254 stop:2793 length:540 start_codon:yes stop_codon:yes gene_type:complete
MKGLEKLIEVYIQENPEEIAPGEMLFFLRNETDVFSNNNYKGHFTGSGWIVSSDRNYILMTHHKKIGKWLQLGGHADGEVNLLDVALREAKEESGIRHFSVLSEDIFDLDIHKIPNCKSEPSHLHYDVRFLLEAVPEQEKITVSDESHDVAWFPIKDLEQLNPEISIRRMIKKTLSLKT